MRRIVSIGFVVVVLASTACARSYPEPDMQPTPGRGYTVETTGAAVGVDRPDGVEDEVRPETIATRLAEQMCAREAICKPNRESAAACRNRYLGQTRREIKSWRCSPAATRARAERCLATIKSEPCAISVTSRPWLCAANAACEADAR